MKKKKQLNIEVKKMHKTHPINTSQNSILRIKQNIIDEKD